MHSDQDSRDIALLALAAGNDNQHSACPSAEALGTYIDGMADTKMKRDISAHLTRCSDCREHWLEVSNVIATIEQEQRQKGEKQFFSALIHHLQRWFRQYFFQPWFSGTSLPQVMPAAILVLSIAMLMFLLPNSSPVADKLDSGYAELRTHVDNPPTYRTTLPLPWENTSLAFNQIPANKAQRALGAGLWQGQFELGVNRVAENPFPASNTCCWEKTPWADFYLLGRWLGLLWWQTLLVEQGELKHDQLRINWMKHREVLISLRESLQTMTQERHLSITLKELDRLASQLTNPVQVTKLHREVLHAVHLLGPTAL